MERVIDIIDIVVDLVRDAMEWASEYYMVVCFWIVAIPLGILMSLELLIWITLKGMGY